MLVSEALILVFLGILLIRLLSGGLNSLQRKRRMEAYAFEQTEVENRFAALKGLWQPEDIADQTKVVILDAGHGGRDAGCLRGDVYEKDLNLAIALETKRQLEQKGYTVICTREDDVFLELEERTAIASRYAAKRAVFVSIHINSLEQDAYTSGAECYADASVNERSAALAREVLAGVTGETGCTWRKLETESDYYVTRHSVLPACLIETGYLSSDTEYPLLCDKGYQTKIAAGIAKGIEQFFEEE